MVRQGEQGRGLVLLWMGCRAIPVLCFTTGEIVIVAMRPLVLSRELLMDRPGPWSFWRLFGFRRLIVAAPLVGCLEDGML